MLLTHIQYSWKQSKSRSWNNRSITVLSFQTKAQLEARKKLISFEREIEKEFELYRELKAHNCEIHGSCLSQAVVIAWFIATESSKQLKNLMKY